MTTPAIADQSRPGPLPSRKGSSSLSIVIPARNARGMDATTIERTLAARDSICADANLSEVEVLVVGKGPTERSADVVISPEITLIADAQNLEYRAAVETGLARASGDLLAVLDPDVPADPRFFGPLCRMLAGFQADIAVAALPEGANAMRVMRRATVERLHALPDGVDFLSPVSSITRVEPGLTVVQVPLGYGDSKANVVRDGVRVPRDMALTAIAQRPLRVLGPAGAAFLLFALGYGLYPVVHYLRERRIEEAMFYRLAAVAFAITAACNLILAGLLAQQSVAARDGRPGSLRLLVDRALATHLPVYGLLCVALGSVLSAPVLRHYLTSGEIGPYWSHMLAGGFVVVLGVQFISFSILARALRVPPRDGLQPVLRRDDKNLYVAQAPLREGSHAELEAPVARQPLERMLP